MSSSCAASLGTPSTSFNFISPQLTPGIAPAHGNDQHSVLRRAHDQKPNWDYLSKNHRVEKTSRRGSSVHSEQWLQENFCFCGVKERKNPATLHSLLRSLSSVGHRRGASPHKARGRQPCLCCLFWPQGRANAISKDHWMRPYSEIGT
jgi:hypothetical protein